MSRSTVESILHDIEALNEEDRLHLERELARRFEAQWTDEAAKARGEAARRGIDQAAIDAAIEQRRYAR